MPLEQAVLACEVLRCSMDEFLGRVIPALEEDEQRLLDLYRVCPPKGREYILQMAEVTSRLMVDA